MEKNTEESSYKLFLNVGFIFFFLGGGIMKNSLKYQASEGKTEGKTCMEDFMEGNTTRSQHRNTTRSQHPAVVLHYLMHRFPVTKTQSVG